MGKVKKKKKVAAKGDAPTSNGQNELAEQPEKESKPKFTTAEVFGKPSQQSTLFQGFREAEVDSEIVRLRMMTESIEHGRGRAIVRNFAFRKFKEQPRGVLYLTTPRGLSGGSFEPTDRLLKPGEQVQLSYTMNVEGADRPIYFMGKGFFLRKSFTSRTIPKVRVSPGRAPEMRPTKNSPRISSWQGKISLRSGSIQLPHSPADLEVCVVTS